MEVRRGDGSRSRIIQKDLELTKQSFVSLSQFILTNICTNINGTVASNANMANRCCFQGQHAVVIYLSKPGKKFYFQAELD
jgi:hypothetical protein